MEIPLTVFTFEFIQAILCSLVNFSEEKLDFGKKKVGASGELLR